jgi:hypothetical protein
VGPYAFSPQLLRSRCNNPLNGSIKPPGGENGRDGEASTFLADGAEAKLLVIKLIQESVSPMNGVGCIFPLRPRLGLQKNWRNGVCHSSLTLGVVIPTIVCVCLTNTQTVGFSLISLSFIRVSVSFSKLMIPNITATG